MTTSDVFQIALGRAVTCERIERGMKRKNLVAASQISPAYLAAIENGDRTPSYTILNRLAAAMGMSVSGIIARALEIADDPRNGLIPDGAPWPPTTENTRSDLRKQVRKQPLGW